MADGPRDTINAIW